MSLRLIAGPTVEPVTVEFLRDHARIDDTEFWLGHAAARGIQLSMPHETSLLDACEPEKFYGFDTRTVQIAQGPGRLTVTFAERNPWPTAEEVEARYDHSVHPNPLVTEDR